MIQYNVIRLTGRIAVKMSFTNKVVLVTGASSGIGAAIALKFAEQGAHVAIVGRNEEKLKHVSENIVKVGKKPLVLVADVTKRNNAQKVVSDTLKQFGKLDVLVNNAGIAARADITEDNAIEVFDSILATNLQAPVYLTHLASKHLIETKGNIINISSVAGQSVTKRAVAYCTSKAALDHFSRSIALDFAEKGVRVNTISPGPVMTDIIQNMGYNSEIVEATYKQMLEASPLKRVSDPVEIAEIAIFLASDKAVGITGSTYVADNGFLLGKQ